MAISRIIKHLHKNIHTTSWTDIQLINTPQYYVKRARFRSPDESRHLCIIICSKSNTYAAAAAVLILCVIK